MIEKARTLCGSAMDRVWVVGLFEGLYVPDPLNPLPQPWAVMFWSPQCPFSKWIQLLPQVGWEGEGQGCIGKGGRYPPPLQGAQPMPSYCPPDGNCQPQWHL